MELERELTALAADLDWPPTPGLRLALEPRRRRRQWLLAALAVAVAGVVAAFAVPQSRGAILRFFHLRHVSVEVVERLPPAEERPLGSGLGVVVSRVEAARSVAGLLLPPLAPQPPLHLGGGVVSLVFAYRGEPVLLSELGSGDGILLKKVASGATRVEPVVVGGEPGLWLQGQKHAVLFPGAPARLAGNVLVWARADATYRLEGRDLTLRDALGLAASLTNG